MEKFAELMHSVWLSKNDYERRAREVSILRLLPLFHCLTHLHPQLLSAISDIQTRWNAAEFKGTYADAREHSARFSQYKQTTKRTWVTEKQDVTTLFGNIQTKLRTYGLREYVPPPGLALSVSRDCLRLRSVDWGRLTDHAIGPGHGVE